MGWFHFLSKSASSVGSKCLKQIYQSLLFCSCYKRSSSMWCYCVTFNTVQSFLFYLHSKVRDHMYLWMKKDVWKARLNMIVVMYVRTCCVCVSDTWYYSWCCTDIQFIQICGLEVIFLNYVVSMRLKHRWAICQIPWVQREYLLREKNSLEVPYLPNCKTSLRTRPRFTVFIF